MTVVFRDKMGAINVTGIRRNKEVLDLFEKFVDGNAISQSDSLF